MKLVAKVRFIHEKNVQHLIRSFFQEFNPKSSITIKGEVAELEIYFEKLPMEIVDSITHCEVIEFICAPHLWQDEEKQGKEATTEVTQQTEAEEATTEVTQQEETVELTTEESEQAEIESEISEEPESAKTVEIASEEPNQAESEEVTSTETTEIVETASEIPEPEAQEEQTSKSAKKGKRKKCEVPELAEFAKESESYEAFVNNVATWLDLGKSRQFFVKVAEKVRLPHYGLLHWKDCKYAVGKEEYSDAKKISCTAKVAAKFKGSDVTILKLLEAIVEYRTFDFQKETTRTDEPKHAEETLAEENPAEESPVEPNLVVGNPVEESTIMSDIPCFKEAVENVDKTLPIEARVTYVLVAMGVEKLKYKDQRAIWEIANAAVRLSNMNLDDILSKTEIPKEDVLNARMTFTTFINNVVKEHARDRQIKLVDFLKALQKGIMLETEIEDVTE